MDYWFLDLALGLVLIWGKSMWRSRTSLSVFSSSVFSNSRLSGFSALLIAYLVLQGCSLAETRYVSNPDVDVAQHQTYSWVTEALKENGEAAPTIYRFDKAIRTSVIKELESKGYRWVESGGEMLVDYRLVFIPETVTDDSPLPPEGVAFERPSNTNTDLNQPPAVSADVATYTRGEITVSVYSPDQQQRYWEGSVSRVSEQEVGQGLDDIEATVPRHITRLLRKFPKR
jgi:uncharacterized protein DUF4136